MDESSPPLAVKLMAWKDFLWSALFLVLALVSLAAAVSDGVRAALPADLRSFPAEPALLFAALYSGFGWAVWKGKRWARVLHLVWAALTLLGLALGLAWMGWIALERAAGASTRTSGELEVWDVLGAVDGALTVWLLTRPMARWWFSRRRTA